MSRYIDAEHLKTVLNPPEVSNSPIAQAINTIIDFEPTADVAPIVHAHWEKEPYYDNDEEAHYDIMSCSHCHYPFTDNEYWFVKNHDMFCPECGAKMDEGGDDE